MCLIYYLFLPHINTIQMALQHLEEFIFFFFWCSLQFRGSRGAEWNSSQKCAIITQISVTNNAEMIDYDRRMDNDRVLFMFHGSLRRSLTLMVLRSFTWGWADLWGHDLTGEAKRRAMDKFHGKTARLMDKLDHITLTGCVQYRHRARFHSSMICLSIIDYF